MIRLVAVRCFVAAVQTDTGPVPHLFLGIGMVPYPSLHEE